MMYQGVEIPDWAKWIAKDKNGDVYVYDEKPYRDEQDAYFCYSMGVSNEVKGIDIPGPWQDSLREINQQPAVSDSSVATGKASSRQIAGDHYKTMGIQTWDVVDTWPIEQQIGYYRGNALKYVMRMGRKDENVQEIKKGIHYLEKLVEVLECDTSAA